MNVWQVIWIVLNCFLLGINLAKHGQPRNDKYNFWISLIDVIVMYYLLRKGGFF